MRDLNSQETEILLRGARKLAAMKELGLSEDQLFDILQNSGAAIGRAQQRGSAQRGTVFKPGETQLRPASERGAAAKGRNTRRTVQEGAVVRDTPQITGSNVNSVVKRLQAANDDLRSQGLRPDAANYGADELFDAGFADTARMDEEQTMRAGDRNYVGPEEASISAERQERAEKRRAKREAKFRKSQPRFENVAGLGSDQFGGSVSDPTRAPLVDAARRVQAAVQMGEITPEEGRALESRLLVASDPRLAAMADRRQGTAAVQADSARFSTPMAREQRSRNDVMFAVEMEGERRTRDAFNEAKGIDAVSRAGVPRGEESILYDTGFGAVEPTTALMGSNTPTNANALNAPDPSSAISWVARQVEGPEGGFYDGARRQEVDIQGSLGEFNEAVASLGTRKVRGALPFQTVGTSDVRSIAGLQSVINQVKEAAIAAGVSLPRMVPDPTTGQLKAQKVKDPGVQEVMELLKMNVGGQQRLGLALDVLDQTGSYVSPDLTPINAEKQRRFRSGEGMDQNLSGVTFGVKDLSGSGINVEADLARAPQKRAQALRDADISADASMPFIGQVRGESAPVRKRPGGVESPDIPSFLRAKEEDMYAGKGGVREDRLASNIASAQEVDRRASADESIREQRAVRLEADRAPFMYGRRYR